MLQLCILPVLFSLRAQLAHLFPFTFSGGLVIIWNRVRGGAERGTVGRSLYPNNRFEIAEKRKTRGCAYVRTFSPFGSRLAARSQWVHKFTVKAIRGERVLFSSSRFLARSRRPQIECIVYHPVWRIICKHTRAQRARCDAMMMTIMILINSCIETACGIMCALLFSCCVAAMAGARAAVWT